MMVDGNPFLAALHAQTEYQRVLVENGRLQQEVRQLRRQLDTIKVERENWRARCGQ